MKRVVILTAALLLVAGTFHSVRAEEGSRRGGAAKSEVRIGYGMLSANSVVNSYSDMLADFLSDGSVAYANGVGLGGDLPLVSLPHSPARPPGRYAGV